MTGNSLCIMRPNHGWTALHVSVLAVLFLTLNADSEDSACIPGIEVRRHTVYNVFLGEELWIKCPVRFCNNKPPEVSWIKFEGSLSVYISNRSYIRTEWETVEQSEGVSYLIFQKIDEKDAGVYHCQITGSVGHHISVNVYDQHETSSVPQTINTTQKGDSDKNNTPDLLIYVYCAGGITLFVVIVIIISIIAMKGCKGKTKKEAQTENQYMSIPMVEQPVNRHVSPRGSPCVPPSRRSTQRKSPSRQQGDLRSSRDDEQLYQIKEDRNRQRPMEESSSVVYAALNHELPQRPNARRPRPVEEQSEYAAIRVG